MKLASLAYAHRQYEPAREWFDRLHRANPGDAIATQGLVQANRMLGLDPDRTRDLAEGLSRRYSLSKHGGLNTPKTPKNPAKGLTRALLVTESAIV